MFRKQERRIPNESPRSGEFAPSASGPWMLAATRDERPVPDATGDASGFLDRRFARQARLPTQAEIRRECRKIRRKWSPCERLRRKAARRRPGWEPPILAMDELQAILSEDQANGGGR